MRYKNWYRIFLNFHREKKNSEGKDARWRIVMCRKHQGKLFLFSPGQERAWRNHMFTMLERAWRKHIFSIPGLVTLKPEPGENMSNFTWYFQTPLAQDRSFAFQYLIANIIKAYPTYFFRLQPHYFSISESKKKRILKWEAGELESARNPFLHHRYFSFH